MSLYIGKLSEHVRKDELERVFCRFGQCNVQVKREGYGFVVFDSHLDAETALKALKGRNICGEPLTLMWSNKQPKSHCTKFDRAARRSSHELQGGSGRSSDRLDNGGRKEGFDGRRNHKMGIVERGKSVDVSGEEKGYDRYDFKDYDGEEKDQGGDFPDEGGGVVPNQEDNGGWVEPTHDPAIDYGNGDSLEFDRYESYHGYDRKKDKEDYHVDYSRGSPAANSQNNVGRALIGEATLNPSNGSKFQETCYRCGEGHKMRNCTKEHSSRRKYNRLDVGKDDKIDKELRVEDDYNKFGSGAWGAWVKPQSNGDALLTSHQIDKQRVFGSRQDRAPLRNESSPVTKDTERYKRKEYGGRKPSINEIEPPKRSRAKISRRLVSPSLLSDHSAYHSLTNSQLSNSLPRSTSYSRSRSVSSRVHSSSKSQNYRVKKSHLMRSSFPTSLSVSLNQLLPPPPNKIELNLKKSSTKGASFECVDHLVAREQQIGSTTELENLQSKDSGIAVNGKAAVSTKVVDDLEKDQHVLEDNNDNLTKPIVAGNFSPRRVKGAEGFQHSGTLTVDDIQTEIQKPTLETHVNFHSGRSTIISTEEMCMVLNKSGLELPKDHEKNLTAIDFFGAARLWPWHVIYYRRLKKGPISIENYARRVAQNQEFNIVDKFIRSSSGWGEFSLENS